MIKMKVNIKSKKKTIAKNVEFMDSSEKKTAGLMFAKKGKALLVADWEGVFSSSIHTMFCKPLLIAWINSKNVVVDVKKTRPWWFYFSKKPAKYVFETTNMKTKIKPGERIKIINLKRS